MVFKRIFILISFNMICLKNLKLAFKLNNHIWYLIYIKNISQS